MKRMLFFLALGLLAAFWWQSMMIREIARQAAKRECNRFGLQLIDDTVERIGLKLGRDDRGALCFMRTYRFEFVTNGDFRYKGHIQMRGRHIERIDLEPYAVN